MRNFLIVIAALIFSTTMVFAFGFKPKTTSLAEDGCCAGHKGVCGCQGQRAMCCDGAVAANCGCLRLKEDGEIIPSKAYQIEE